MVSGEARFEAWGCAFTDLIYFVYGFDHRAAENVNGMATKRKKKLLSLYPGGILHI